MPVRRGLAAYYERVMGEIRQYPFDDLESLTSEIRKEYVQAAMYTHNFVTPGEITLTDNAGHRVRLHHPAPVPPVPPARPFTPLQTNEAQRPAAAPRSSCQPPPSTAEQPRTPLRDRGAIASFPTPAHIQWRNVEITFVGDLKVDIVAGDVHRESDFIEMDMVDHKTGQPNELWNLFRRFCETGRIVAWTAQPKVSRPRPTRQSDSFWDDIDASEAGSARLRISIGDSQFKLSGSTRSQDVSELRKKLKAYFKIPGNPIELRSEKSPEDNVILERYWKPSFKSFSLTPKTAS